MVAKERGLQVKVIITSSARIVIASRHADINELADLSPGPRTIAIRLKRTERARYPLQIIPDRDPCLQTKMRVQGCRLLQDIDVNQTSVQALSGPASVALPGPIPAQLRVPPAVVHPPPPRRQRKKPGPKTKSFRQRVLNNSDSIKPLRRVERSYNRETKIRVLKFYYLHKIPVERYNKVSYYRTPSISETGNTFLIPESTIQGWLKKEKEIVEQECGSHRAKNISFTCKWPELEEQLYSLFLSRRAE